MTTLTRVKRAYDKLKKLEDEMTVLAEESREIGDD
jgi:hypothetical protein